MKLLFHAFPRAAHTSGAEGTPVRWLPPGQEDLQFGLRMLDSILRHGLLCVPQRMPIHADPETERHGKRAALQEGRPYKWIVQSRACFTLMDRFELTQATGVGGRACPPHAQVFGPFAIGLDPVAARALGICPVFYHYRHLHAQRTPGARGAQIGGLGQQIISRLDEISAVFAILSAIESAARPDAEWTLSAAQLESLGIRPELEPEVERLLARLTRTEAEKILRFFDTDRVAAWNMVDFIHMLLSFYQSSDSTIDGEPLAFFAQREWRLVHHDRRGMQWTRLSDCPPGRAGASRGWQRAGSSVASLLAERAGGRALAADYLKECWLLEGADGLSFRDFVRQVVVPAHLLEEARELVGSLCFQRDPPEVLPGVAPWTVREEGGTLRIVPYAC